MDAFDVRTESDRVRIRGELDIASAPELRSALARVDGEQVVLDLRDCEFIDSSGLHALIDVRGAHPGMRIVNVPPPVRRVFDIAGVTQLLLDD